MSEKPKYEHALILKTKQETTIHLLPNPGCLTLVCINQHPQSPRIQQVKPRTHTGVKSQNFLVIYETALNILFIYLAAPDTAVLDVDDRESSLLTNAQELVTLQGQLTKLHVAGTQAKLR